MMARAIEDKDIGICETELVKLRISFAWQLCLSLISTQQLAC